VNIERIGIDFLNNTPEGFTLRQQQDEALKKISDAYNSGIKFVVGDFPVGSGKSLMAVSVVNALTSGYVVMPNNNLVAQYSKSFDDVRTLRGRKWLPCTYGDPETNRYVLPLIHQGKIFRVEEHQSCSGARCTKKPSSKKQKVIAECAKSGPCPYTEAVEVASKANVVVTNLHAFSSQNLYNPHMFGHRKVIIVDEAHLLHSFLRGYLTTGFTIDRMVATKEVDWITTFEQWIAFLSAPEQVATFNTEDKRDDYKARIEKLQQIGEGVYGSPPITNLVHDPDNETFRVEFVPNSVGGAAKSLIYDYADFVVLMSGSWGDKTTSMREIGLDPAETRFISMPSDFPKENRPVVLAPDDLDMSHRNWEQNLPKLVAFIKAKMKKHPNEKGLIHVPSFSKGWQIIKALKSDRILGHVSEDFHHKFDEFIKSDKPVVFVSPSCTEGVDLKDDLCRWQVLTAVPYPPAGSGFYQRLLSKGGWLTYNTHTLRQIMQMLGRPVRSKTDHAVSYMADTRFNGFIQKMWKNIPQWLRDGFVPYER